MFTRKHYKAIAEILSLEPGDITADEYRDLLVARFASWFKSDNPNFDPTRFYAACYQSPEKSKV